MGMRRKQTFKVLAREILEQKELCANSTYGPAKVRIDRLVGYFGGKAVTKITDLEWAAYVRQRLKDRPGSKLFDDKKYMRQIMLEAYRRGIAKRTFRFRIPDISGTIGREIFEHERKRLFRHASKRLRFQMDVARLMGLRRGELLKLRWTQFDWKRRTILFQPADVKTRKAREVPINPDLFREFRFIFGSSKSALVFPSPGNPLRPENIRYPWAACKRKASVQARWHDWRHTAATRMLRLGYSIQAVKLYLGMSEKVLTRIYNHLNIDDLRKVASGMRRA